MEPFSPQIACVDVFVLAFVKFFAFLIAGTTVNVILNEEPRCAQLVKLLKVIIDWVYFG